VNRSHAGWGRLVAGAYLVCLAVAAPLSAQAAFQVDLDAPRLVRFTSRTALNDFDGVTEKIDGFVALDTPDLSEETGDGDTEFYFEVDLASIDTGVGLRNRHMRDNYLEVEDFPYAAFGGSIERVAPLAKGAYRVTISGTLGIHGVERERSITCDVSPDEAGYSVECSFPVLLSDHGIEIPKIMFLKLNDEVRLEVDFRVEPSTS
jgi:polyisoprenoid-binding protein YceI